MSTLPLTSSKQHFQPIDGLRCIAAGLVVLQHTLESTPVLGSHAVQGFWGDFLVNNLNLGRLGVIIFFLISGFLIPSTLKPGVGALPKFFISRLARLYPLYWFSMLTGTAVALWLALPMLTAGEFVISMTMLQKLAGVKDVYGPYWTLFVEMVFYASCVGLFVIGQLHRPQRIFVLVGGFAALSCGLSVASVFTSSLGGLHSAVLQAGGLANYLMVMFTGYLIRLYYEDKISGRQVAVAAGLFVASFMVYAVCRTITLDFGDLLGPKAVFFSSTLGLLAFWLTLRYQLWTHRYLVYVGMISYGVYLFHGQVLHIGEWLLGGPATNAVESVALLAFVVAVTGVISHLAYQWIETPSIRLGVAVRKRLYPSKA